MPKQKAIEDRFEGLAADALEDLIVEVEKREQVKVIALEVELVPEGDHQVPPAVDVHVTVTPRVR